jgi:hypothetical protein
MKHILKELQICLSARDISFYLCERSYQKIIFIAKAFSPSTQNVNP